MSEDEKSVLLFGYFATSDAGRGYQAPEGAREGSAGFVPGVARLGIPPQWQTDAGIGVATQPTVATKRERTALPSNLGIAASWDPGVAQRGGEMIGREAWLSGFNVLLAGGVNLIRDPRNGRNFEYTGEDPLLAGTMAAAQIFGVQSNHIVSTVKHFAMNDMETGRQIHDVRIDRSAARMSDLLAFQFAIEQSDPGAVMCAYNRFGGDYACQSKWLLTDVLRNDWHWRGYVMSDWGATHSAADAANAGLEQQTGWPFDKEDYFRSALRKAMTAGTVSQSRFDEMVARILRTMFDKGLFDYPVAEAAIDFGAHAKVTREAAEAGAVLLKNSRRTLPLSPSLKRVLVIGGHADRGVLSGGGSSQTYPIGGNAVPGIGPLEWPGPTVYYPSSPLRAMREVAPNLKIDFLAGDDIEAAATAAATADAVVVFATQWSAESIDNALTLPDRQDALIARIAAANSRTVVVLETGGPVLMPWADKAAAIMETWYPGTNGGEAIANLLFGKANPSGKLPLTFPRSEAQLPRPKIPGSDLPVNTPFTITYDEGAAVGYKWFDQKHLQPLFPFGHGLSYSRFEFSDTKAAPWREGIRVSFTVRNAGKVAGSYVAQVYVSPVGGGWEAPKRLGGFAKVALAPGQSRTVSLDIDPRLLAIFDERSQNWHIAPGIYRVMLAHSAQDTGPAVNVRLRARALAGGWSPADAKTKPHGREK